MIRTLLIALALMVTPGTWDYSYHDQRIAEIEGVREMYWSFDDRFKIELENGTTIELWHGGRNMPRCRVVSNGEVHEFDGSPDKLFKIIRE